MIHRIAATTVSMLVIAACGGQPSNANRTAAQQASPPTISSTNPSGGEVLFAVLEPGGDLTNLRDSSVAIVRVNGVAKAKARFDARQLPRLGGGLALPQPEARVAAGKVFYADAKGVIRSLTADGTVANVTTIPLTSGQQMLSFAINPDGTQLLATVFSFPPVHNPPPQNAIDPPFGPGDFTNQEWSAKIGENPTQLAKRNWPQSAGLPMDALEVVGWSTEAPLATIDSHLGTNEGSLGRRMFGHVAELDTAGRPGPQIGGYTCNPWTVLPDETVLCDDDGSQHNFSVRSKGGAVRFHFQATGDDRYTALSLSPDAARVAYQVSVEQSMVVDKNAKTVKLAPNFRPEGWLDAATLVGVLQTPQSEGDMALVRLDHPSRVEDLGFHGFFVGVA